MNCLSTINPGLGSVAGKIRVRNADNLPIATRPPSERRNRTRGPMVSAGGPWCAKGEAV